MLLPGHGVQSFLLYLGSFFSVAQEALRLGCEYCTEWGMLLLISDEVTKGVDLVKWS